jgi:hypothetical protein
MFAGLIGDELSSMGTGWMTIQPMLCDGLLLRCGILAPSEDPPIKMRAIARFPGNVQTVALFFER